MNTLSKRRLILVVVALILGAISYSASAQQSSLFSSASETTGLELLSPANQTLITDPGVEFKWTPLTNANKYRLNVRGDNGFSYKAKLDASGCTAEYCAFSPTGDSEWKPKFGQTLSWLVAAKIGDEKVKSETWTLQTAFLPDPVTVYSPVANAVFTEKSVTFSWQNDARVETFKLQLQPDKYDEPFVVNVVPSQSCDETTCTVTVDLAGFNGEVFNGTFDWRVIATRSDVKGKSKSDKQQFTTDLLPDIELEYPTDGITISVSNPDFMWIEAPGLDKYRIVAVDQDGESFKTGWYTATQVCEDEDCYSNDFVLPNGVYEWRVEGRVAGIDGKAKSESWTMKVYSPEVTPEALP